MSKYLLFTIALFFSIYSQSQITFEKGYYITNADQKVDGFIKNMDWKNNPDSFEFKLVQNDKSEMVSILSIREFGIDMISKFIKSTVEMDRSSDNLNKLTKDKEPSFKKELLLLKVLVEGKASLFSYQDGNLTRYFYKMENSDIQQLVYKTYLNPKNRKLKNTHFRKQVLDKFEMFLNKFGQDQKSTL